MYEGGGMHKDKRFLGRKLQEQHVMFTCISHIMRQSS